MQPVDPEELKQLIKEAKEAGKDVSELEKTLEKTIKEKGLAPSGERKEKKATEGKRVIESTGPAREEDFE